MRRERVEGREDEEGEGGGRGWRERVEGREDEEGEGGGKGLQFGVRDEK